MWKFHENLRFFVSFHRETMGFSTSFCDPRGNPHRHRLRSTPQSQLVLESWLYRGIPKLAGWFLGLPPWLRKHPWLEHINHVEQKNWRKKHIFFLKDIYICIYICIYIWTKMENISIDIHRIWKTSVGSSPFYAAQRDDVSGLRLRALASLDWAPWSSLSITAFWKSLEDVGNIYIYIYTVYIYIYI